MKEKIVGAARWLLGAGSFLLVFLATASGAGLANLYAASHGRRHSRNENVFIATTILSALVAAGIVLHDELRKSDRDRKRARLGTRIANGFSHGFAWRGAGDALELFVELLVGGA